MTAPVRVGMVGAGAIAQSYAQAFQRVTNAEFVGVTDTRPEAANALAEAFGTTAFESAEEMADRGECEAVIICTPPASHRDVSLLFLERRIAVLCEKPLSVDRDSAREMIAAAEGRGVLLTMASKFRYVEDVVRAKALVASGVLGDIVLFENAFTGRVNMSGRWNSNPAVSGGGVLIDNGTHSVDIVRYFLGPISKVQAVEGKRIQGLEVEDTARMFIESQDGVMANIDLSWSIDKELESFIEIHGSQGTVQVGWKRSRYRLGKGREWVIIGQGYDKIDAFRRQIENFCGALRGVDEVRVTPADALSSVEVIAAAYESLRAIRWAPVNGASA